MRTPIYDLEDLAEYIDLRKYQTKKKPDEVGLGRNVSLFDKLRKWAYVAVRKYRGSERNFVLWSAETYGKALEYNGDFVQPLLERECYHIAKSVSKWTWRKDAEALAAFKARQSAKGQKGGKGAIGMSNRWGSNESKQASARIMAAKGMTIRAIAEELGISKSTVGRWVSE